MDSPSFCGQVVSHADGSALRAVAARSGAHQGGLRGLSHRHRRAGIRDGQDAWDGAAAPGDHRQVPDAGPLARSSTVRPPIRPVAGATARRAGSASVGASSPTSARTRRTRRRRPCSHCSSVAPDRMGSASGIHWHASTGVEVEYIATDEQPRENSLGPREKREGRGEGIRRRRLRHGEGRGRTSPHGLRRLPQQSGTSLRRQRRTSGGSRLRRRSPRCPSAVPATRGRRSC